MAAFAALLSACGGRQQSAEAPKSAPAAAPANCDKVVRHPVAFTTPDAQDAVEARALGPDCARAALFIIVRRADGVPLYSWAAPYGWTSQRIQGDTPEARAAAIDQFLADWANVRVDTTASLPDWPQRENVFKDQLGAFLSTPFEREQYLDIRRKAAPRLCFATGLDSGECIYYDAQNGAAVKVLETGA
jgi:hypothetical protein